METQRINGWDYIDSIGSQSGEYIKEAKQAEASGDRAEAARKYTQAANLISKMVEDINDVIVPSQRGITDINGEPINLSQGMVVSANMLRINREKYLKKAEKLSKPSFSERIFRGFGLKNKEADTFSLTSIPKHRGL